MLHRGPKVHAISLYDAFFSFPIFVDLFNEFSQTSLKCFQGLALDKDFTNGFLIRFPFRNMKDILLRNKCTRKPFESRKTFQAFRGTFD